MREPTELKVFTKQKETLIGKYINSLMAGDIKNLTIKEDYIMLEELKMQREEYVAEVERLRNVDLNAKINERFELVREQIANEVVAEHEVELNAAELNVKHYDFVIETMEAKAIAEAEVVEDQVAGEILEV